jgi:hypothetical protein
MCEGDALLLKPISSPFALVVLESLTFCSGWPGLLSFCLMLPFPAGMTGTSLYTEFFLLSWDVVNFFLPGLAETMILPISASHETWDDPQIFKTNYRFPLKERFTDVLTQQIMIRDFTLRIKSGNICYQ